MKKLSILLNKANNENLSEFEKFSDSEIISSIKTVSEESFYNSQKLIELVDEISDDYLLIIPGKNSIKLHENSLLRYINILQSINPGILYSDYLEFDGHKVINHPTIDYQIGSVRDNFDFGPLTFVNVKLLKEAIKYQSGYKYSGLYFTRLYISAKAEIMRVPEFLYTVRKDDYRKSGEKQFDYVDPSNREIQIEYEKAFTEYLKIINAYLQPGFKILESCKSEKGIKASVLIPVKNRVKTIKAAIESVIYQKTNFEFNLLIVDNHSADGTSDIIKEYQRKDKRIIHIIPESKNFNIGGCWNKGINDERCGEYVVQLDSDDIYFDESTLQVIIDKFEEENAAMVIGSYKLTDFNMNELPPGIIDHREWTPENGRNNALRINGLGAPRAFRRDIVREIGFPDVSYGEDYFMGLAISRDYQISRIYDPIYICRRWEENSDADLDIEKENKNNLYKDRIRTIEILSRINKNKNS